jgi:hypothetical protein
MTHGEVKNPEDQPLGDDESVVTHTDAVSSADYVSGVVFKFLANKEIADVDKSTPNPIHRGARLPGKRRKNKTKLVQQESAVEERQPTPVVVDEPKVSDNEVDLMGADTIFVDVSSNNKQIIEPFDVPVENDEQYGSSQGDGPLNNGIENEDPLDDDFENEEPPNDDSENEEPLDDDSDNENPLDDDCENEDPQDDAENDEPQDDDPQDETDGESVHHEDYDPQEEQFQTPKIQSNRSTPKSSSKKSTPRIRQSEEVEAKKREYMIKLDELRDRGIKISKTYTMKDSLDVLQYAVDRHSTSEEVAGKMKWIKTLLNGGAMVLQFVNMKFAKVQTPDFTQKFAEDLENNDAVIYSLAKKLCRKGQSSPIQQIIMLYITAFVTSYFTNNIGSMMGALAGKNKKTERSNDRENIFRQPQHYWNPHMPYWGMPPPNPYYGYGWSMPMQQPMQQMYPQQSMPFQMQMPQSPYYHPPHGQANHYGPVNHHGQMNHSHNGRTHQHNQINRSEQTNQAGKQPHQQNTKTVHDRTTNKNTGTNKEAPIKKRRTFKGPDEQ